jgi:transcriptional regulator with XRE-family HTH domain
MTKAERAILTTAFGKNIRQVRNKKQLTVRQVAANCNLDNSTIAKIENGNFNVSLSTIVELARGLEIHPSQLLTLSDIF